MKRVDRRKLLAEFKDLRASVRRKFSDQEIVSEIKRARRPALTEVDKLFGASRKLARKAGLKKADVKRAVKRSHAKR